MELFRSPRLRCRRLLESDLPQLCAVYGDPLAMRWVGDGSVLDEAACRLWLSRTEENYQLRGYGMFALEDACGEVVGFCGLVHPNGQAEPELKYAFKRMYWGRGYASEAASALLAWAARSYGLSRVIATIAPENRASERVLRKAGMVLEAVRRDEHGLDTARYAWQAPNCLLNCG
jgi:[ribosomal protein S5]-alanine N-acetyltransferase